MIQLSYNPITGANYQFEPIREFKRRRNRNPNIDKKALEQLTRVVEQASLSINQLQGALLQCSNNQNNSQ